MKEKSSDRSAAMLCYGDRIIVGTSSQGMYMGSRGMEFQSGFYARYKRQGLFERYHLYPNLHELVFEIHPQLNFEALVDFNECKVMDPNKAVLNQRMVVEQNLNEEKLKELAGKHVTLGSVIQLLHVNSQTYVRFSTQKIGSSEMGGIENSKISSESVQFTIGTPFDFLKGGASINYEEKFTLNDKYGNTLAYPINEKEFKEIKMVENKEAQGWFGGTQEKKKFKTGAVLEQQESFESFFAGYVGKHSIGSQFSNEFEVILVESSESRSEKAANDFRWGDLLNIRRVDNTGKYSAVCAEVNRASLPNTVIYRHFEQEQGIKPYGIECQFQIVPITLKGQGKKVQFDRFNSVACMLKHVLSGKFLYLDQKTGQIVLSEDFESQYEELKATRNATEREHNELHSALVKQVDQKGVEQISKKDFPWVCQRDIDIVQQRLDPSNLHHDLLFTYVYKHTFILEKASAEDLNTLNHVTFFRIRTSAKGHMKISEGKEVLEKKLKEVQEKERSDSFTLSYSTDELIKRVCRNQLLVDSKQDSDIFIFEPASTSLSRLLARFNAMVPYIINTLHSKELTQLSILKYSALVSQLLDTFSEIKSTLSAKLPVSQLTLLQSSLPDLLLEYLLLVARATETQLATLAAPLVASANATLRLLDTLADRNPLVCAYLAQWEKFIRRALLHADAPLFNSIHIENLLYRLVETRKDYRLFTEAYLKPLVSRLKFNEMNSKKLNIITRMVSSIIRKTDGDLVDTVYDICFDPLDRVELFRYVLFDNQDLYLETAIGQKVIINEHFCLNLKLYNYYLLTLGLAVILAENNPTRAVRVMHDFYPKKACLKIIDDPIYPTGLKSMFLKLFGLINIISHIKANTYLRYESKIITKNDSRSHSDITGSLMLKDDEESKSYIGNLMLKVGDVNKEIVLGALRIVNSLVDYRFFEMSQLEEIFASIRWILLKGNFFPEKSSSPSKSLSLQAFETETEQETKTATKPNLPNDLLYNTVPTEDVDSYDALRLASGSSSDNTESMIQIIEILTKIQRIRLSDFISEIHLKKEVNSGEKAVLKSKKLKKTKENRNLFDEKGLLKSEEQLFFEELNSKNEPIRKFIIQWLGLYESPELPNKIMGYLHETCLTKENYQNLHRELYPMPSATGEAFYKRMDDYTRAISGSLKTMLDSSDYKEMVDPSRNILQQLRLMFQENYWPMNPVDRSQKRMLSLKMVSQLNDLRKQFAANQVLSRSQDSNRLKRSLTKRHLVQLDELDTEADSGILLLNAAVLKARQLPIRQILMNKSGHLELLMKLAKTFNYKLIPQYEKLVHLEYSSEPTLCPESTTEKNSKPKFQEEMNLLISSQIYMSVVANKTNADFLIDKYGNLIFKFILTGLESKNNLLKRCVLAIAHELFSDNLRHILLLKSSKKWVLDGLLAGFERELLAGNHTVLCNFMELFQAMTFFNFALIEDIAKRVAGAIFHESIPEQFTIGSLISKDIRGLMEKPKRTGMAEPGDITVEMKMEGLRPGELGWDEGLEDLELQEKELSFRVLAFDDRVRFLELLALLLADWAETSSSDLKYKLQKSLSLTDLLALVTAPKATYALKAIVLHLLSSVFITSKIDQNTKTIFLDLLNSQLFPDIKELGLLRGQSQLSDKEIFMVNLTPSIASLWLEADRFGPNCNEAVFAQSDSMNYYVLRAVLPFVQRLLEVCTADNKNILDSINLILNKLLGNQSLEQFDSLNDDQANPFNKAQSNLGLDGNSLFGFTNANNEEIEQYIEKLQQKVMSLKLKYDEEIINEKFANHRLATRKLLSQSRNADREQVSDTDALNLPFFKELKNLMVEVEEDDKGAKGGDADPSATKLKNLFTIKGETDVETSRKKGSPEGKPSQRGEQRRRSNTIRRWAGEEDGAQGGRMSLEKYLQSLLWLIETNLDEERTILTLRFLANLLRDEDLSDALLPYFRRFRLTKTVHNLMIGESTNQLLFFEAALFLNSLFASNSVFQNEFKAELKNNFDNKFMNIYFKKLELAFHDFLEMDSIVSTFAEFRETLDHSAEETNNEKEVQERLTERIRWCKATIEVMDNLCQSDPEMQDYIRCQVVSRIKMPFEVNFFKRISGLFRQYSKVVKPNNFELGVCFLKTLISATQGPCFENQQELILHKIMNTADEMYGMLCQKYSESDDHALELSNILNQCILLKTTNIEGTRNNMVIKTMEISFNPEVLWVRVDSIYRKLFGLRPRSKAIGVGIANILLAQEAKMKLGRCPRAAVDAENIFGSKLKVRPFKVTDISKSFLEFKKEEEKPKASMKPTAKMPAKVSITDGNDYSDLMKEGLNIIIYMFQLGHLSEKNRVARSKALERLTTSMKSLQKSVRFFEDKISQIEILNADESLQTVFFAPHPINQHLSDYTKTRFLENLDRKSSTTKLNGLMRNVPDFIAEIDHFAKLKALGLKTSLSYLAYLKSINFFFAVGLNLILLIWPSANSSPYLPAAFRNISEHSEADRAILIISSVILAIYILIFLTWLFFDFFVKLRIFKKEAEDHLKRKITQRSQQSGRTLLTNKDIFSLNLRYYFQVIWGFLSKTNVLIIWSYILFCVLGIAVNKFYFSLLMLDLIDISPLLWNVIRSLTLNARSLGTTCLFGLIMFYIYASFAYNHKGVIVYTSVVDQEAVVFCDTFPMCFLNTVTLGLRSGGGIGDALKHVDSVDQRQLYLNLVWFELVFFVTIILMFLNIILGIIIDSFAELRNRRDEIGKTSLN
jgi:hypothetical protein